MIFHNSLFSYVVTAVILYFVTQIQPVLLKVFSFYSRSPKRYRELKAVAAMKNVKVISLKRAEGTRWVAHRLKAMEAFLRNYPCLITHWEDVTNPARADVKDSDKAIMKGFLTRVKKTKFMAYMVFYMDILRALSAISAVFQRADLSLQEVKETVKVNLTYLQELKSQDGPVSSLMVNQFRDDLGSEEGCTTYRDVVMVGGMEEVEQALSIQRDSVITSIVMKLEDRFKDFTEDPIIRSCEVFDHTIWPEDRRQLSTYGEAEISTLLEHFQIPLEKQGVNLVSAKWEWGQLKMHIATHYQGVPHRAVWKAIFQKKRETFPNILHLVAVVMVLPISNAQLERAFSAMGRVLTDWRKTLKTEALSDLLLITMEGPCLEEFDAKAGVSKWLLNVDGKIRPNRKLKKKDLHVEEVELESDTDKGEDEEADGDDAGDQEPQIIGNAGNGDAFEDFGEVELDSDIEEMELESDEEKESVTDDDAHEMEVLGVERISAADKDASDDTDEQLITIE